MVTTIKSALRNKDLSKKLRFTFLIILLTRLGSQIPVPGINLEYFKQWFAENNSTGAFNFLSAFTGGSFERFSIFGLGITPFITASIIIQLLTIAIPALEELRRDGDYGQKKLDWINRWTAIGLAFVESLAMAIGFSRSGLLPNMTILRMISVVFFLTGGSALLIFMGWTIDKKGIGNGTSIILLVNIIAGIPQDMVTLFEMFVKRKTVAKGALAAVIILAVILGVIVLVILLNEAYRKVSVQYTGKLAGKSSFAAHRSFLPIKLNTASVIPVIFASSLFSVPQMFASILGKGNGNGVGSFILNCLNQNNWFNKQNPQYSIGLILYIVLIYFFAYFYTSITFNPIEIADNLKKQGSTIPGIRQGKPTEEYLGKIINKVTILGATGLIIVVMIPLFISGMFNATVSFGGTSLIIIVGVILETMQSIDAQLQSRQYKSFI